MGHGRSIQAILVYVPPNRRQSRDRLPTLLDGEPPETERAPPTIRAPVDDDGEREDTVTDKVNRQPSGPVFDRATITLLTGKGAGRTIAIDKEAVVLGRSRDADIQVVDGGVSRQHARIIRWVGLAYVVQDLASSNGTFVNGRRIERASLSNGDRLQLGPSAQVRFSITDETESQLQTKLYEGLARDPTTDVYTRDHLLRQLRLELAYARRHDAPLSLVLAAIRRASGKASPARDTEMFRRLAGRVAECGRIEDLVARYDDEILAVILRTTQLEAAVDYARHVFTRVRPLLHEEALTLQVAVANIAEIGFTDGPEALTKIGELRLKHCDAHADEPICAHPLERPTQ